MPPNTQCEIAAAIYVIRRVTTYEPTMPSDTLASRPTNSA